jgi:hypothetical protein
MQKIVNNAVIEKCGECNAQSCIDFIPPEQTACRDKIHSDCPLQSVEVIEQKDIIQNKPCELIVCSCTKQIDIDKIIIVKKGG